MKTPICDFVKNYAHEGKLRLHMPGHKGIPFLGVEDRDITEVDGADVLYSPDGIIAESENMPPSFSAAAKRYIAPRGLRFPFALWSISSLCRQKKRAKSR